MPQTIELLERALERKHASAWARDLNITPAAISAAKKTGRLSPVLAGNFAIELGEDPVRWMAAAAMEAAGRGVEADLLARLQARWKS